MRMERFKDARRTLWTYVDVRSKLTAEMTFLYGGLNKFLLSGNDYWCELQNVRFYTAHGNFLIAICQPWTQSPLLYAKIDTTVFHFSMISLFFMVIIAVSFNRFKTLLVRIARMMAGFIGHFVTVQRLILHNLLRSMKTLTAPVRRCWESGNILRSIHPYKDKDLQKSDIRHTWQTVPLN